MLVDPLDNYLVNVLVYTLDSSVSSQLCGTLFRRLYYQLRDL